MTDTGRKITPQLIYGIAMALGVINGLVALALLGASHAIYRRVFDGWGNGDVLAAHASVLWPWEWSGAWLVVCLVPMLGALLTGICIRWLDRDAAGGGTEQLLQAFHLHEGRMARRTPFVKWLTTWIASATGASGGKEGPMLLIGGGVGALVADLLHLGARARRTLLLAGAAAGLGAVFRIPLAGAIIAVEVLYAEDFESDALIPCLIASITGYSVVTMIYGQSHTFWAIPQQPASWAVAGLVVALALLCTLSGALYVRISHAVSDLFAQSESVALWLRPLVGAAGLSVLLLFVPAMAGSGIDVVQVALSGGLQRATWYGSAFWCALLALTKMLASACSTQSGGSVGTLIPCVFIGAMVGAVVGHVGGAVFPSADVSLASCMVLGMAGMLSAVTKASLGALIMACELTGGYDLLPYLMVVSIITLLTTRHFSLYRQQLPNRFASPAHAWEVQRVQNAG